MRSVIKASTVSSGTKSPRLIYSRAAVIAGVRSSGFKPLAVRKISPVESWQAPSFAESNSACVPLPTPGEPSKIKRRGRFCRFAGRSQRAVPPFSHACRSALICMMVMRLTKTHGKTARLVGDNRQLTVRRAARANCPAISLRCRSASTHGLVFTNPFLTTYT